MLDVTPRNTDLRVTRNVPPCRGAALEHRSCYVVQVHTSDPYQTAGEPAQPTIVFALENGWRVSSYYVSTMLERNRDCGLTLDGQTDEYVDADDLEAVYETIASNEACVAYMAYLAARDSGCPDAQADATVGCEAANIGTPDWTKQKPLSFVFGQ